MVEVGLYEDCTIVNGASIGEITWVDEEENIFIYKYSGFYSCT